MNWCHDCGQCRQKALGSEVGTSQLRFSRQLLGGATLAPADSSGTFEKSVPLLDGEDVVDVEVSTLGTDFPVDLPIRMLKIDAEGFEHHVLRGGQRLFERQCIDLVLLECVQEVYGKNWSIFLAELKKVIGLGYAPYVLKRSSKLQAITFDDILSSDRGRNVVLISNEARSTIRELR